MAEPGRRVLVVANPPDVGRIAAWLGEEGLGAITVDDGGAGTLGVLAALPADVVVLDAGLRRADPLILATALRQAGGPGPQLVLIADEAGGVRNALDAMPYRADRFLRRPLARAALVFAVRSCLRLGRGDVVTSVLAPSAATAAARAVLDGLGPAPRGEAETSDVALHTLVARIEEATAEAVEAFLSDKLEEALSAPPLEAFEPDEPRWGTADDEAVTWVPDGGEARRAAVAPRLAPAPHGRNAERSGEAVAPVTPPRRADPGGGTVVGRIRARPSRPPPPPPRRGDSGVLAPVAPGRTSAGYHPVVGLGEGGAGPGRGALRVGLERGGPGVDADDRSIDVEILDEGLGDVVMEDGAVSAPLVDRGAGKVRTVDDGAVDGADVEIVDAMELPSVAAEGGAPSPSVASRAGLSPPPRREAAVAAEPPRREAAVAAEPPRREAAVAAEAPRREATVAAEPPRREAAVAAEPPRREATAAPAPPDDPSPVDEFDAAARMPPVWRDPTVVLAPSGPELPVPGGPALVGAGGPALRGPGSLAPFAASPPSAPSAAAPPATPPAAPDEARTGTFVSALRRHMSAVEARLFGGSGDVAPEDDSPPEIDLDSIALGTPAASGEREPLASREPQGRPAAPPLPRPEPPRPPARFETRPPVSGDLGDEDVASLLGRLARESFTGRVTFRSGDAQKLVVFDDGRPIFAGSNQAHDRMGELLVREGKITREQIGRASDLVTQSGRRMGEILVDLGYLKRRELLPAVRRHIEDILYSLFSWEAGSYTAVAGGTGREEKIRLAAPTSALVVEGLRRKVGLERLRVLLGPSSTVVVPGKPEELSAALADADLGPEERRTLELFDGQRDLGGVVNAALLPEEQVLQLGFSLVALGLARPRGRETGERAAAVAPAPAPSSSLADLAIDRERILAKHAHVREADYCQVLGVRRDATAFEIRRAHDAARRDYAGDAFAPELARELAGELAEIAVVLGEAHRVLGCADVRQRYLAHLKE